MRPALRSLRLHQAGSHAVPNPLATVTEIVIMSSTTNQLRGTCRTLPTPSGSVNGRVAHSDLGRGTTSSVPLSSFVRQ